MVLLILVSDQRPGNSTTGSALRLQLDRGQLDRDMDVLGTAHPEPNRLAFRILDRLVTEAQDARGELPGASGFDGPGPQSEAYAKVLLKRLQVQNSRFLLRQSKRPAMLRATEDPFLRERGEVAAHLAAKIIPKVLDRPKRLRDGGVRRSGGFLGRWSHGR